MKIKEAVQWLDGIAPLDTAEDFDNVGLIIGDPEEEITAVMFGLDVTMELLQEAVQKKVNLIVTHHPFLFHAFKRIRYDSRLGHCLSFILEHHLHVMAAHTNWDQANGGISDTLADRLSLKNIQKIDSYLRVGCLEEPMDSAAFLRFVEERLQVQAHLYGAKDLIHTVGAAGGSYGRAAAFCPSDALVTGEIIHSDLLEGTDRGLVIVCAEHYATEYPGLVALYHRFSREIADSGLPVYLHEAPPFEGARV